jgi:plasmid stabilization system protein ParE
MRLYYRATAEADLDQIADFYDKQEAGLGYFVLQRVDLEIRQTLAVTAGIHRRKHGFYCMLVKRFHLGVFYKRNEDQIDVHAVLDLRQKPSRITRTLRERTDA